MLPLTYAKTNNIQHVCTGLTHICLPDLWLVGSEHPSCLGGPPWYPPVLYLGYHSKRWPVADLNQQRGTNLNPCEAIRHSEKPKTSLCQAYC